MPRVYDGQKHANRLGAPCVGCGAAVSKKWVGAGPYACTSRACQRALAAAPHDGGERGVVAPDHLAELGDALPSVEDAGAAAGDGPAAAGPPSVDAPALVHAAAQTDGVDGLVDDEQLHAAIADLHAVVAEKDGRIEELEAELGNAEEALSLLDGEAAAVALQEQEKLSCEQQKLIGELQKELASRREAMRAWKAEQVVQPRNERAASAPKAVSLFRGPMQAVNR